MPSDMGIAEQQFNISIKIYKILNNMTGWAAGSEGVILKTTNGGGQGVPIGIKIIRRT